MVFLDEGILGQTARAQSKLRDMAPSLARQVIAAKKLVEAAERVFEEPVTLGDMVDLHNALTAFREVSK